MTMTFFLTPEVIVPPTDYSDKRSSATTELADTWRRREIGTTVLREVSSTLLSLRGGSPNTVLGALLHGDGQSRAEIESRLIGVEPPVQLEPILNALQMVGLVESHDDQGVQRFNLVLVEEQF